MSFNGYYVYYIDIYTNVEYIQIFVCIFVCICYISFMGTVFYFKSLFFIIHTLDHEPPHVTVYYPSKKNYEAKARVNLLTCTVIDSIGFSLKSLKTIEKLTKQKQELLLERWYETRPK